MGQPMVFSSAEEANRHVEWYLNQFDLCFKTLSLIEVEPIYHKPINLSEQHKGKDRVRLLAQILRQAAKLSAFFDRRSCALGALDTMIARTTSASSFASTYSCSFTNTSLITLRSSSAFFKLLSPVMKSSVKNRS
jgi:hypothetical protein